MRRLVIALVLVILFASVATADKTVSRTYYSSVLTDVTEVRMLRSDAAPSGWVFVATVTVRASDGQSYITTLTGRATSTQKTAIETFITNNVLAATNTQEGL